MPFWRHWAFLAPQKMTLQLKGVIRDATGIPYGGVTVRAFDKDLRTEEVIGETITDGQGSYEIKYVSQDFSETEKGGADLLVRVFGENKNLLATSDIFYNAPAEQIINLIVYADQGGQPSEWETINAQLLPLLKNQKNPPVESTKAFLQRSWKETIWNFSITIPE